VNISMRSAVPADKPFLVDLEEVCMRDYAVALWGKWRPRPDDEFTIEGHRIILDDRDDIGCVAAMVQVDHVWIDKLYLLPKMQRKGIGSSVLKIIQTEAVNAKLPIKLSVLITNPALDFYLRNGFRMYRKTPERSYLTM
jgi:GNAT superfamily N-acetyltransferase